MSNLLMTAVYASFAGLSLVLLVLSWAKRAQDKLDACFRFLLSMMFCWQFVLALYFSSANEALALYLYDFDLPFVAFSTLAWLLYIVNFYGLGSYFPTVVRIGLFVVPLFTLGLALTTPLHNFLRTEVSMLAIAPFHVVYAVRGPWFWYHTAYCYALVVAGLILAFSQHRKIGIAYRRTSALLLICTTLTAVSNLLVLKLRTPVDITLISLNISSLIIFIVTKNIQGLAFFQAARRKVFHYIDRGLFIVDAEGGIVSMNQLATELVGRYSTGPVNTIHDTLEMFSFQTVRKDELDGPSDGVDYYLASGEVYNIYTKPFLDNRGHFIGSITAVADVKDNRRVINYLDAATGMDALTGLANRRTYEGELALMDKPGNLPLTLMIGDLNSLKAVNDTMGHPQGDIYLRVAAGMLKDLAPPSARIARTGGDEFVILLPHCTETQAATLTQVIQNGFAELSGYPFTPSIALGHATKQDTTQNTAALLKLADEAMYKNKQLYKENARQLQAQAKTQ